MTCCLVFTRLSHSAVQQAHDERRHTGSEADHPRESPAGAGPRTGRSQRLSARQGSLHPALPAESLARTESTTRSDRRQTGHAQGISFD